MANLSTILDRSAAGQPDRTALRLDDLSVSYRQLSDAARRVATLLKSVGVDGGDRVGLMLPNIPAFPVAFYGALTAGAVVVPMNPLLKGREVAYYLGDSGARVLFVTRDFAGEAAKGAADAGTQLIQVDDADLSAVLAGVSPASTPADAADGDDAVILYTSGTTGQPKGAQLSHGGLTRNARLTAETLLPKNPWLADHLLARALAHRYQDFGPLVPLTDQAEAQAQAAALRLARRPVPRWRAAAATVSRMGRPVRVPATADPAARTTEKVAGWTSR